MDTRTAIAAMRSSIEVYVIQLGRSASIVSISMSWESPKLSQCLGLVGVCLAFIEHFQDRACQATVFIRLGCLQFVDMLQWPDSRTDTHRMGNQAVRSPSRDRQTRGSNPTFHDRVISVTNTLVLCWLLCPPPVVKGSVLGQADPVSVHCDWVR